MAGRSVRTLHDGPLTPEVYTLNWDGLDDHGRKVVNGVHFCHMAAPGYKDVKKVVLNR